MVDESSGNGRSHTRHGEERKQQLLDAAAVLFAQHGYASTRIADICREAGVAKGLFYWYFPTKAELFTELVRVMRRRLRRAQADAMDPEASALARIGIEVSWIWKLGLVPFGDLILGAVTGVGVATRWVQRDDAPTGLLCKWRSEGRSHVTYRRAGSAASRLRSWLRLPASTRRSQPSPLSRVANRSRRRERCASVGAEEHRRVLRDLAQHRVERPE